LVGNSLPSPVNSEQPQTGKAVDNVGGNRLRIRLSARRRRPTFADQITNISRGEPTQAVLFEYPRCNYLIPGAIVILKQIASYSNSISLFAELI
jgi:hypothetical protein